MIITDHLDNTLRVLLRSYDASQICAVADESVPFEAPYPVLRINADEANKTIDSVAHIWDFLFGHGMTRRGVLLCVGGGIVTDIGGFAAATYKRGIDYINVPTTLLAMVDASTGGKTGINYCGLKNAVGCFASPVETVIVPGWLDTLPFRQFLSGFGEMLKTGLIEPDATACREGRLWDRLLQYDLDAPLSQAGIATLVAACIGVKDRYVAADPKEKGLRKALNFGHTFGHALEEMSFVHRTPSAEPMLHGYAVVYGMIAELYLSVTRMGCPKEPLQQLTRLMLHYYGKPDCRCSDREGLVRLMQQDKKNEHAAEINCTLLKAVGEPVVNRIISPAEANEALEYLFSL